MRERDSDIPPVPAPLESSYSFQRPQQVSPPSPRRSEEGDRPSFLVSSSSPPPPPFSSSRCLLDVRRIRPFYPPEDDEGPVEYKWQLLPSRVSAWRFDHLLTQMLFRLREGMGRCTYCIGVADDGKARGLPWDLYDHTRQMVFRLATAAGATAMEVQRYQFSSSDDVIYSKRTEKLTTKQEEKEMKKAVRDMDGEADRSSQSHPESEPPEGFLYSGEMDVRLCAGESLAAGCQSVAAAQENPEATHQNGLHGLHKDPNRDVRVMDDLPLQAQIALCGPLLSGKTTLLSVMLSCQQKPTDRPHQDRLRPPPPRQKQGSRARSWWWSPVSDVGEEDESPTSFHSSPISHGDQNALGPVSSPSPRCQGPTAVSMVLDDGGGLARHPLLSHRHEIVTGRNGSRAIARPWDPPLLWCPPRRSRNFGENVSDAVGRIGHSLPPTADVHDQSKTTEKTTMKLNNNNQTNNNNNNNNNNNKTSTTAVEERAVTDFSDGLPHAPFSSAPQGESRESVCSPPLTLLDCGDGITKSVLFTLLHRAPDLLCCCVSAEEVMQFDASAKSSSGDDENNRGGSDDVGCGRGRGRGEDTLERPPHFPQEGDRVCMPPASPRRRGTHRKNRRLLGPSPSVSSFISLARYLEMPLVLLLTKKDLVDDELEWDSKLMEFTMQVEASACRGGSVTSSHLEGHTTMDRVNNEHDPPGWSCVEHWEDDGEEGEGTVTETLSSAETRLTRVLQRDVLPIITVSSVTGEGLPTCGKLFAAMKTRAVCSIPSTKRITGAMTRMATPSPPLSFASPSSTSSNLPLSEMIMSQSGSEPSLLAFLRGRNGEQTTPHHPVSDVPTRVGCSSLTSTPSSQSGGSHHSPQSSPLFPPHPLFLAFWTQETPAAAAASSRRFAPSLLAEVASREYFEFMLEDVKPLPALAQPPPRSRREDSVAASSPLPLLGPPPPEEIELRGRLSRGRVRIGQPCVLGPLPPEGRFVPVGTISALRVHELHVTALQASELAAADSVWMTVAVKMASNPEQENTSNEWSLLSQFLLRFQRHKRHPKGRVLLHTPPLLPLRHSTTDDGSLGPLVPPLTRHSGVDRGHTHTPTHDTPTGLAEGEMTTALDTILDTMKEDRGELEHVEGVVGDNGDGGETGSAVSGERRADAHHEWSKPMAGFSSGGGVGDGQRAFPTVRTRFGSTGDLGVSWGCVLRVHVLSGSTPLSTSCQPLLLARHTMQAVSFCDVPSFLSALQPPPLAQATPRSCREGTTCVSSDTNTRHGEKGFLAPALSPTTNRHGDQSCTQTHSIKMREKDTMHISVSGTETCWRCCEFLFSPEVLWVGERVVLLWPPNGLVMATVVALVPERRCAIIDPAS